MRRFLFAAAAAALLALPATAQQPEHPHAAKTDGSMEGGWVVSIPAGTSDFFNTRHQAPATGTAAGINVAVSDFGAASSYPRIGLYPANLGVDPTGDSPDISLPLAEANSPPVLGGPLHDHVDIALPTGIPLNTHVSVQFPPGDPGLLGVAADTDLNDRGGNSGPGAPDPHDASAFSQDAYATPGLPFDGLGDFGLGINHLATSKLSGNSGFLQLTVNNGDTTGDFTRVRVIATDQFGVAFFAPKFSAPTLWLLFLSFLGAPIKPVGPVLPTIPAAAHTWIRVGDVWPSGAGNITINFVAISGAPGVFGSVAISNEVTVSSVPDPNISWGALDDCTYESGWVVSFPTGPSDYFNVNWGDKGSAVNGNMHVAVMDFGTAFSSYPSAGFAPPNLGVDPGGFTPDLGNVYNSAAFPFPSLTFVTTCGQMISNPVGGVPASAGDVIGFVQFPPGDSGLLGIGGDTNGTVLPNRNGWTLDGYSTPANLVGYANWGIRAD